MHDGFIHSVISVNKSKGLINLYGVRAEKPMENNMI